MGLAFIEQVELLCYVYSIQTSEKDKDLCASVIAVLAKDAKAEFKEDSVLAGADCGPLETLSQSAA